MKALKPVRVQPGTYVPFRLLAGMLSFLILSNSSVAQSTRTSVGSGNWPNKNTWDCNCVPAAGDDVVIKAGHTVTSVGSNRQMRNLMIELGGTLTSTSSSLISGNLVINGNYNGSGVINLTGAGATIDGTGTISNTNVVNITGNKTILATTNLTKSLGNISINENATLDNLGALTVLGSVVVNSNVTVNNYGTITLDGSLLGGTTNITTRIFNNFENASLSVASDLLVSGTSSTGILNAGASGNTVLYTGPAAQNIKVPDGGQYHHLSFSGTGSKTLPSDLLLIKGNFSNGSVMVAGSGTVEFNGATEITGTTAPSFNNVVVATGASLTSYNGDLNVAGDFTDNGTFVHNNGTVVFNGTAGAQSISGTSTLTSFRNFSVNSAGGLSNNKPTEVYGIVNVGSGVTFNANGSGAGSMTLRSTSESTADDASIGQLLNGAAVTGIVRHERFMSAIPRIYRYLSSPVQQATVGSWSDDFHITGSIPGLKKKILCGYSANPSSPSLFYYDEVPPGDHLVGYVAYPLVSGQGLNSPLEACRGYAAFIRNCTPIVIKVDGEINSGDIVFNSITYSNSGNFADGFNLVGNPYPSAIDWASPTGWDRVNIGSVAAVTNNHSGFTQFEYLDASDGNPQVIAAGQGFWIQTTADGPSMTIHETAKTTTAGAFYRQRDTHQDHLVIKLSDGSTTDKAFTKLRSFAAKGKDRYDGVKIRNTSFDLFIYAADGAELAINSTPEIKCGESMRLGIRNLKAGAYRLDLEAFGKFGQFDFFLMDSFTGKRVKLEKHVYEFNVDSNNASAAVDRFALFVEDKVQVAPVTLEYTPLTCDDLAEIKVSASSNGVEYRILTETDSLIARANGNGQDIVFTIPSNQISQGKNLYHVQLWSACGMPIQSHDVTIVGSEVPQGFELPSAKTCGPGTIVLEANQLDANETVHWFSTELDDQPVFTGTRFTTPLQNKSRTYFAEIVNEFGCSSGRIPVIAEVVWMDSIQIWMTEPGNLHATSENAIWYLNGDEIGTGPTIAAVEDGTYTAEVYANGCASRATYNMIFSGEVSRNAGVSVYPNPFSERIEILAPADGRIQSVRIVGEDGKTHAFSPISIEADKQIFNLGALAPGLYLVHVAYDEGTEVYKLIKR